MVTSNGLLVSWWRWPSPGCAFAREPLASKQRDCGLHRLLLLPASNQKYCVAWEDSSKGTSKAVQLEPWSMRAIWALLLGHRFGHFESISLSCILGFPCLVHLFKKKKKVILTEAGAYLPLYTWKLHLDQGLRAEGQYCWREFRGEFWRSKTLVLRIFLWWLFSCFWASLKCCLY